MSNRIRVWDLPTRLFHWSLVALFVFSFVTGEAGGNWLTWHFRSGYAILTLILFRILWGFAGGRYARFSSFFFTPAQIFAYLRKAPDAVRTLGHNPLGSLSVFALVGLVGLQAVTGLFANDDIAAEGPLAKFVSNATSSLLTSIHHINEKLLVLLVLTHVGAILFYLLFKRENLIGPMVHGDRVLDGKGIEQNAGDATGHHPMTQPAQDGAALRLRGLLFLLICAGLVAALVYYATGRPSV